MSSKEESDSGSGGGDKIEADNSGIGPDGPCLSSPKKLDQKVCGVCSDKALGYNFNAITCESCKAFFRRNALKKKEFKCPFSDNCKVDVVTRRFCQKCRLKKCFQVGMKKEWIMTDEEKTNKKRKIEENRHKRQPEVVPVTTTSTPSKPQARVVAISHETHASETSSSEYDSLLSPASVSAKDPFSPLQPEGVSMSTDCSPKSESVPSPGSSKEAKLSPNTRFFDIKRAHECGENTLGVPKSEGMVSDMISVALTGEMDRDPSRSQSSTMSPSSPSPTANSPMEPDCRSKLHDSDRARLQELIIANKAMKAPFTNDDKVGSRADPPLINVINLTDLAIRRLIKMCKKISGFKSLCQEDQIALLKIQSGFYVTYQLLTKLSNVFGRSYVPCLLGDGIEKNKKLQGSCTELMILRSVMTYNPENECWQGPKGPKVMKIKLDVLREANGNVYEEHKRFLHSFEKAWRTDENVMLILGAITLFSPDRPNVVHHELIRQEQDSYYFLLQRYLATVYSSSDASSVFTELRQRIQELHHLNENHVRVFLDVNPKEVEPLLIEIFDLKNH